MTGRDLPLGSSFLSTAGDSAGLGGRWSGWGQTAPMRFAGTGGADGDGLVGLFAADSHESPVKEKPRHGDFRGFRSVALRAL